VDTQSPLHQTGVKEKLITVPKMLYVRMARGKTFYQHSETFEPNETFFVLNISSKNAKMASISLTNDPETRKYFITQMLVKQDVYELLGKGTPKVANLRERQSGKARLSGDFWEVVSPIKLTW